MAHAAFHIDPGTMTLKRFLLSVVLNAVINTVIALIINALGVGMGFPVTLVFSQCIGFSIFFAYVAVLPLYRRAKRPAAQLTIIVAAIIVGAVVGTLLGALANGMRPIGFLREHSGYFNQVILFALLFGFLVSYIFISFPSCPRRRSDVWKSKRTRSSRSCGSSSPRWSRTSCSTPWRTSEASSTPTRRKREPCSIRSRHSFASPSAHPATGPAAGPGDGHRQDLSRSVRRPHG